MSAYDEFRYEEQAINRVVRSLVIFQPVLENAFSHGFMEGDEIRAVRDGDFIFFSIIDDGNPFFGKHPGRCQK